MMGGMFVMYTVCIVLISVGIFPAPDQATRIDVGFVGSGTFLLIINNSMKIKGLKEEITKGKL